MGIKDLNSVINKFGNSTVFKKIKATEMKGKRFAVDISIFINSYVMISQENWFNTMTNFLLNFRKYKINCIIIFDGINVPKEKLVERESRKNSQQTQKVRLEKLKFLKEKILMKCVDGDEHKLVPEQLQDDFKEVFKRVNINNVNPRDSEDVLTFLQEKIDKAEQVAEGVKPHHKIMTRNLVKYLGLPYIEADGEAESLAASMAYQGMVDGVISRDTDNLVYGCPLLVTNIGDVFECVYLKDILSALDITMTQFVDMCICLQCDYNARMPKHGPAAVIKAIKEYKSIDVWKEAHPDKPFHLLKYNRCREIFRPYNKKYFEKKCKIVKNKKVDVAKLDEMFDSVDSKYTGEYVKGVMEGKYEPSYRGNWGSII